MLNAAQAGAKHFTTYFLRLKYWTRISVFHSMSKRAANCPPKIRKRVKNGISSSSQVLRFDSNPTEVMDIWHMNTGEPTTVRKSSIPIPLQRPPSAERVVQFEEVSDAMYVQPAVPACPKPKHRNDSVSHNIPPITKRSQHPSRQKWGPG